MKDSKNLYQKLLEEIEKTPVIDIYTEELAQDIIKKILYENPKRLYGLSV